MEFETRKKILSGLVKPETLCTFEEGDLEILLDYASIEVGRELIKNAQSGKDSLVSLINTEILSRVNYKLDSFIEKEGWGVMAVVGDGGFGYTVGGTQLLGYELLHTAPGNLTATILNPWMKMLKEGKITLEEALEVRTDLLANDIRMKLVEIDAEVAKEEYVLNRRGDVTRIFQVLVADADNILPVEEGYGVKKPFPQVLVKLADSQLPLPEGKGL